MELKIRDILQSIQQIAPLSLQESYDNCGLLIGDEESAIKQVLVCIDVTEEVVDEAIKRECGLIISHHPLIFKGIKKLTPKGQVERIVIRAIANNIAIAAMHTNLDNSGQGVNFKIAEKLQLKSASVLQPTEGLLKKFVTFCPHSYADKVREAISQAGGGSIGNYDSCSFNSNGTGTFRANEAATPYVGQKNHLHEEPETRIEMIVPEFHISAVVRSLIAVHPYEEVAYDIYPLENQFQSFGAGIIGFLPDEMTENEFLVYLQTIFGTASLRHTAFIGKKIGKVAVCGGSGAFLIKTALSAQADAFVTADIKYHDFFEADGKLFLVDAGHFETEQFTKELIVEIIQKKYPTFAVLNSGVNTNAVCYFNKK
jgi:dinuclear metal center YbgI/SA1388 family protein